MGRYPRQRQVRLPEKLIEIRLALDLSQDGMLKKLELPKRFSRTSISNYETGDREPPLHVLIKYGMAAGVCLDLIVNDELELPAKLPTVPKHIGNRAYRSKGRKR